MHSIHILASTTRQDSAELEAEGAEEKNKNNTGIPRKRKRITFLERDVEISKREKKVFRYSVCTGHFVELTDENWIQCDSCEERYHEFLYL
jgi:hypothetical protein